MRIKIVVATRESEERFFSHTALGQSLSYSMPTYVDVRLFSENTLGLPLLYNMAIKECIDDPAILVFVHDDLYLLDYYWSSRILDALEHFNVVGIVGNTRCTPNQSSWCFIDTDGNFEDSEYLSGVISHGNKFPPEELSIYGQVRREVKLLDGVLIAARSDVLIANQIYFDEIFEFHFYDLDFCRQLAEKNLTCGTWDIACQHLSAGHFMTPAWYREYENFKKKWI